MNLLSFVHSAYGQISEQVIDALTIIDECERQK
jgi:hypothetical protein